MPAFHKDENKKKEVAAVHLREADSPAIGRCTEQARLHLCWPWDGQARENTWKCLKTDVPSMRLGRSINPTCSCSWWCKGPWVVSHVWHQRTWPHTEMELNTIFCCSQIHDKGSEIPPWALLRECFQPKLRLCPLSEEGWVLSQAPACGHAQCLISMVWETMSWFLPHFAPGVEPVALIHWVVWSFQRGSFPFHREISNSPDTSQPQLCWVTLPARPQIAVLPILIDIQLAQIYCSQKLCFC